MRLKKVVASMLTVSLIMAINGIPSLAAENVVIKENVVSEKMVVSKADKLREKKWVVDKEEWTEEVLVSPEESHMEKQWVVDKEAWTETIEHPEEFHMEDKYVVDTPAWDEPTYTTEVHLICFVCGLDETEAGFSSEDMSNHNKQHVLAGEGNGYGDREVQVQTGTIHHPEVGHTEQVKVVDKEAWTETIEHPEEGHWDEVKVVDKEAVYDYIVHLEEGHYEYIYTDPVAEFVARLYTNLLQREADDNGLTSWRNVLKSGKEQGVKVAQGFVESNEFQSRSLSDTEYIKILYRTFLGREADSAGLNSWLSVLDNGLSRLHVFKGFAESDEFTKICSEYGIVRGNAVLTAPMDQNEGVTKFVARCYKLCLGRKADEDGLNSWCRQILTGANTAKAAAHGFVFSDEFKKKNLSDEEFVKTMYRVFMDREADKTGLNAWVKVLRSGKDREHVFNGFADSPEFRKICAGYGVA